MSNGLSKRIAAIEGKKEKKKNIHLPAFLALKDEIEQAIRDGWSLRQIWGTLHVEKKITCTYPWFLRLTNKHIPKKTKINNQESSATPATTGNIGFLKNKTIEELI